jgi:hypothetical protein
MILLDTYVDLKDTTYRVTSDGPDLGSFGS